MGFKEKDRFLDDVIKYIRFPFVRAEIRKELEDHILDSMEYYKENGYDEEEAAKIAVGGMGDAREIGKALNKEHNPFVGWMLGITYAVIIVLVIITGTLVIGNTLNTIFDLIDDYDIPEGDIVYEIDVDKKVQIDDRVIHFKKLVYDNEGNINIFYWSYNKRLFRSDMVIDSIGRIYDEQGIEYRNGSERASHGLISNSLASISNFPIDAKEIVIVYDYFNRYFEVRIQLPEGGTYE